MQADALTVEEVFLPDRRLRAPLFQRRYVWREEEHLGPFWRDVEDWATAALLEDEPPPAFLGATLLQQDKPGDKETETLKIIDGQQRLATLALLLAAIATEARSRELDDLAAQADRRLRLNDGAGAPKLLPTEPDREHFAAVVLEGGLRALARRYPDRFAKGRLRLLKSVAPEDCLSGYVALLGRVSGFALGDGNPALGPFPPSRRLAALLDATLHGMRLVVIMLDPTEDAARVFEAMNARGAKLSASDLVRNDVVSRARRNGERARPLIDRYWRPLAADGFWRAEHQEGKARTTRRDTLLRRHLHAHGEAGFSPERLFDAYRRFAARSPRPFKTVEAEMAALAETATRYRRLHSPEVEATDPLARLGARLAPWEPSAMVGAILAVALADDVAETDRTAAYDLIAGYFIRRCVADLNRRNLHRVGAGLVDAIRQRGRADVSVAVARYLNNRVGIDSLWPTDWQFADALASEPVRKRDVARARRMLVEIEAAVSGRAETEILAEAPHVEHIMPRDWSDAARPRWPGLPDAPDLALDDLLRRRLQRIDSLGNLALLEPRLNLDISNAPFRDRRPAYAQSRYLTTQMLARFEDWQEPEMEARVHAWSEIAVALWPGPDALRRRPAATLTA